MTFQQIEYSSGIFEEFDETPRFVRYVQQKHQAFLNSIVSDVGSSALSTEMDSDVIEQLDEILPFGIWFKCHIKKQKHWFEKKSVPNQWLRPRSRNSRKSRINRTKFRRFKLSIQHQRTMNHGC